MGVMTSAFIAGMTMGGLGTAATVAGTAASMAGVAGAIAGVGAIGGAMSSMHQSQKAAAGQQHAAAQYAAGVQATEAEKTREQIATMEAESKKTAAEMKAAPGIAAEEARKESIRRRAGRARTLLTSPQGALGTATVSKKTLLGG